MKSIIQQKIWNSIRVFKLFSSKDIQYSSGSKTPFPYATVWYYLTFLKRAGYIKLVDKNTYKLVKYTGKLAPCSIANRGKRVCFDPNTNTNIKLQERINKSIKDRLKTILETVTSKESFTLKNITNISGNYNKAKRDLRRLQTMGLVECIKGHENGAIKTFKIIKSNKEGAKMDEDFIPIPAKITQ